jgi:ribosomal-protein-alanine N-acetyltransferase
MASFLSDPCSVRYLPFPAELRSEAGAKLLIEQTMAAYETDEPSLAYGVDHSRSGRFIGFCGLNVRSLEEIELLYGVVRSEWGRGFGTSIASLLCRHVEETCAGARCIAFVHPKNGASLAILTRLGFTSLGLSEHEMFEDPVLKLVKPRSSAPG